MTFLWLSYDYDNEECLLTISLPVSLSVSVFVFVSLSQYLSASLSLSQSLSVCLSVSLNLSISLSVSPVTYGLSPWWRWETKKHKIEMTSLFLDHGSFLDFVKVGWHKHFDLFHYILTSFYGVTRKRDYFNCFICYLTWLKHSSLRRKPIGFLLCR